MELKEIEKAVEGLVKAKQDGNHDLAERIRLQLAAGRIVLTEKPGGIEWSAIEAGKKASIAGFDRVDPDASYLVDCLLIPRHDQQGVMFDGETAPGKVCARLEGYAIIPKERYEA